MKFQICSCPIHRAIVVARFIGRIICPINPSTLRQCSRQALLGASWATTIILVLCICLPAHAKKDEKTPKVLRVPAGASIPSIGLAIDASYDPNTDNIVPGYKILSVAITNNSINILSLNKDNDEWEIVDIKKRRHKAVLSLKDSDPDTYIKLPQKLRKLIDYPTMVQVGETRVIDLLFKDHVQLDAFRMVKYTSDSTKKSIEVIAQEN